MITDRVFGCKLITVIWNILHLLLFVDKMLQPVLMLKKVDQCWCNFSTKCANHVKLSQNEAILEQSCTHTNISLILIVGFFIPVSSLKVFGHSIHSERRRIYPGKSIQALQNDTIIISWLFSFRIIQPRCMQWHTLKTFMFVFIFSFSLQNLYKVFDYQVPNQCKTHNFQPQNTNQNFYMA